MVENPSSLFLFYKDLKTDSGIVLIGLTNLNLVQKQVGE